MNNHYLMSRSFQGRLFPLIPRIFSAPGDDQDSPFQIYDEEGIKDTLRRFLYAFPTKLQHKQFFAVKATPEVAILKMMHELGSGFDCSSIPELRMARSVGATPEQIMFTSNNTTTAEFQEALTHGGCILNLDDISFLNKKIIQDNMPELICFRVNPGNRRTGNSIIGNPVEAKYGIMWEQLIPAYRRARELGATRFGIHTMVASNERDEDQIVKTAEMLLEAAQLLKKELGIELEFINIGGGIGVPYHPSEKEFDIEDLGSHLNSVFKGFEQQEGFLPALFTESGRYIMAPNGVLVNRAINRKDIYETHIGVQIAMPALMRHGMYDAYHHHIVVDQYGNLTLGRLSQIVNIVGPICENCDRLATQVTLPKIHADEETGDFIITCSTGAHGTAMGFNYNGRVRPRSLLLREDGSVVVLRRQEDFLDLFATVRTVDLSDPCTLEI